MKKSRDFREIPSDLVKIFSELIFLRSDFRIKSLDFGSPNLKLS